MRVGERLLSVSQNYGEADLLGLLTFSLLAFEHLSP
jgi:hypothetical protein